MLVHICMGVSDHYLFAWGLAQMPAGIPFMLLASHLPRSVHIVKVSVFIQILAEISVDRCIIVITVNEITFSGL